MCVVSELIIIILGSDYMENINNEIKLRKNLNDSGETEYQISSQKNEVTGKYLEETKSISLLDMILYACSDNIEDTDKYSLLERKNIKDITIELRKYEDGSYGGYFLNENGIVIDKLRDCDLEKVKSFIYENIEYIN